MAYLVYGITSHNVYYLNCIKPAQPVLLPIIFIVIALGVGIQDQQNAGAQPVRANGIQPLIHLKGQPLHQLIPPNIRPLLTSGEQEQFFRDLEKIPPVWPNLRHADQLEQSDRLFKLNRERDEARLAHPRLLQQPVAFLWSGVLRKYMPEYKGFSVALGPELTTTSWGIVRFKPVGLPDYLMAIPPPDMTNQLLLQQQHDKVIEIVVLFTGTLVSDESLIYGFSHDHQQNGMILPVVHIQDVKFILKPE